MSRSGELNEQAEREIKAAEANFIGFMDKVAAAVPQRAEIAQIKAEGLQIINSTCGPAIAAARNATAEDAVAASQQMFLSQCQPAFVAIASKFTAITTAMVDAAAQQSDELTIQSGNTVMTTLVAVIIGLITVLVAGFFAIRSWLVRPIQQMSATMNVLADGDLSANVEGTRGDGAVAASICSAGVELLQQCDATVWAGGVVALSDHSLPEA